jgi:hypothetical protein
VKSLLPWIAAVTVLLLALALYWLTVHDSQQDPCAGMENDVSAAILAGDERSGDALANRAIVQRGACEDRLRKQRAEEGAAEKAPE